MKNLLLLESKVKTLFVRNTRLEIENSDLKKAIAKLQEAVGIRDEIISVLREDVDYNNNRNSRMLGFLRRMNRFNRQKVLKL